MSSSPPVSVRVIAPSRLHFGLFSFGQSQGRNFGGVGAMIDAFSLIVEVRPGERWNVRCEASHQEQRVVRLLERLRAMRLEIPVAEISVRGGAPPHRGLGSGTQLSVALVTGLLKALGESDPTPQRLAELTGRGQRSAVGIHGFLKGGLIVEQGKLPGEPLSPLAARVGLPGGWRFVLVAERGRTEITGDAEQAAFTRLPPTSGASGMEMRRIAEELLSTTARDGRILEFARALTQYGRLAGECFTPEQGGIYASPDVALALKELGAAGWAQSSWGPTIAALAECDSSAQALAAAIRARMGERLEFIVVAAPSNRGAVVESLKKGVQS